MSTSFLTWLPLGYHIEAAPYYKGDIILVEEVEEFAKAIAGDTFIHVYEMSDFSFIIKVNNYEAAIKIALQKKLQNGTRMKFTMIEEGRKSLSHETPRVF